MRISGGDKMAEFSQNVGGPPEDFSQVVRISDVPRKGNIANCGGIVASVVFGVRGGMCIATAVERLKPLHL